MAKLHLMCGVKTNVTSVQVSDGYAHDYSFFKGLVDKTAASGFKMQEVSADKGYLGASNMLATLQRGAIPYIPFKTNSVPDLRGSYGPKSEIWTRMIKSKFGQRLRSKTLTAQINEALCKVLCHNLCCVTSLDKADSRQS